MRQFWIETSTPPSLKVGASMPSTRSSLEMPMMRSVPALI